MKNILFLVLLAGCSNKDELKSLETKLSELNEAITSSINMNLNNPNGRYVLHSTENINTLLRLDSATGEITIVQASMDKYEALFYHSHGVVEFDKSRINRFKLKKT